MTKLSDAWILRLMVLLAAFGFLVSMELVTVHQVANMIDGADSFCNINNAVSCDIVARSHWSVFLGLPVAVWGVFWYSFCLVLIAWSVESGELKAVTCLAMLFGEIFSLVFAAISLFSIKSLCILCAASWTINVVMSVLGFKLMRGQSILSMIIDDIDYMLGDARTAKIAMLATSILIAIYWLYPRYW